LFAALLLVVGPATVWLGTALGTLNTLGGKSLGESFGRTTGTGGILGTGTFAVFMRVVVVVVVVANGGRTSFLGE